MQWETGFCTDIDSEKGILWMISDYNIATIFSFL